MKAGENPNALRIASICSPSDKAVSASARDLWRPGFAFRFVRQLPLVAVLAQAQDLALAAKLLAGQIVEGIDLVRGGRVAV